MPLDWQAVVEKMTNVQRMVHLAMRYDVYDEERIRSDLLKERRRAYEDELTIQAGRVGCPGRSGRLSNGAILSQLYEMSKELGPLTFGDREEMVFLGREIAEQRNYSDQVAEEIDQEVKRIIEAGYNQARRILIKYRDRLDVVARRLIEVETIERQEFEALVA